MPTIEYISHKHMLAKKRNQEIEHGFSDLWLRIVRSGPIDLSFCLVATNCVELDRVVIAFHPKAAVNDDGR